MPYFPPNQPEFNYLRHLYLLGWLPERRISEREIAYYVAHRNEKGRADGWFFDSFLVFMTNGPGGSALYNDINLGTTRSGEGDFFAIPSPNPGTHADWMGALDSQFEPDGIFRRIDNCIGTLASTLGKPPHKHNIVITIPYPHPHQSIFGKLHDKGPRLNLSVIGQDLTKATCQRLEACRDFVDESLRRWQKARYKHLNLLGFYWIYESLHYAWNVDDHWLLKELYRFIRERNSRLFWIPFYSSFNVHLLSDATGFYFDACFLQPNHMFYTNIADCSRAAREAESRGAGIEMEYHLDEAGRHPTSKDRHWRFVNYLNGGVEHGYMSGSACAYFIGFNDVHRMATHKTAIERRLYHDLFHFVKGDYEPRANPKPRASRRAR